jgi:hypothetical protein
MRGGFTFLTARRARTRHGSAAAMKRSGIEFTSACMTRALLPNGWGMSGAKLPALRDLSLLLILFLF